MRDPGRDLRGAAAESVRGGGRLPVGQAMTAPSDHPSLARRPLGRTGLEVTPICIGAGPLGDRNMARIHGYSVPEERALATVRAVFDGPLNFLDTAAFYGEGESERRIGLVVRERGGLP